MNPEIGKNMKEALDKMPAVLLIAQFFRKYSEWEEEKMKKYEERFDSLEKKIDKLIEILGDKDEQVIIVREMSYDEAKNEVIKYFKEHSEADIRELHQNLGIEISNLIKILDELKEKKVIG